MSSLCQAEMKRRNEIVADSAMEPYCHGTEFAPRGSRTSRESPLVDPRSLSNQCQSVEADNYPAQRAIQEQGLCLLKTIVRKLPVRSCSVEMRSRSRIHESRRRIGLYGRSFFRFVRYGPTGLPAGL